MMLEGMGTDTISVRLTLFLSETGQTEASWQTSDSIIGGIGQRLTLNVSVLTYFQTKVSGHKPFVFKYLGRWLTLMTLFLNNLEIENKKEEKRDKYIYRERFQKKRKCVPSVPYYLDLPIHHPQ